MTEDQILFKPKYENFFLRIEVIFVGILIMTATQIIGTIIFFVRGMLIHVIIYFISIIFLLYYTVRPYLYYLVEVIIDKKMNTIEIKLNWIDKTYTLSKIFIDNNTSVQIHYHWFRRYPKYEIRIYHKKKCIAKQIETKEWTREMFEKIKVEIKKLN